MKAKYLGNYYIDYRDYEDRDGGEDIEAVLINEDNEEDIYSLDVCMRTDGGEFHGVIGESNTSAIGIKLNHSGDGAKLWRIW